METVAKLISVFPYPVLFKMTREVCWFLDQNNVSVEWGVGRGLALVMFRWDTDSSMAEKLKNGDGNVSVVLSKVVALIKLANSTTYGLKSWRFTAPKI